jgi:hypothetical protein
MIGTATFLGERNTSTTAMTSLTTCRCCPSQAHQVTLTAAQLGPIIKDKFFLYSYEGRKDVSQTGVTRQVPLASLGRGELRYNNPSGGITTLTTAQLNTIFLLRASTIALSHWLCRGKISRERLYYRR